MISGLVNSGKAVLRLTVHGPDGQADVDFVLDAGFNDFLSPPSAAIASLALPIQGSVQVILGDGSSSSLDLHQAVLVWDGQPRMVRVLESGGGPLVGMALLEGHRVTFDAVEGGPVTIEALP